jgi:catechol 2,3-dioxygenase-like lactoylglutathione lyase family enzyme
MEGQQMAQGARLSSVVIFVHNLDRSVDFYTDILGLEVVDHSTTAALLNNAVGTQLVLREMGPGVSRPLGAVGVQYVVWTVAGKEDLDRCEQALRGRAAHRETRSHDGVTVVEGRDPDDVRMVVTYPGPDKVPLHQIPTRIYGW